MYTECKLRLVGLPVILGYQGKERKDQQFPKREKKKLQVYMSHSLDRTIVPTWMVAVYQPITYCGTRRHIT